ncbi:MAG: plasma membrane localization protein [Chrysothrix sp. TS-e1954]|nr:MAG: plasma membrane localization protein [Chrysothrix sp. TS-e1954]
MATASPTRIKLLENLQAAIGDIATHTYYLDQIGDMVSSLLEKLTPAISTSIPHVATAIENPNDAAEAIANSRNLHEDPKTDNFFSFDTARGLALGAVKKVLVVANARQKNDREAIGRNRVGVSAWDGTQWLLCDPNWKVRYAYVEAILTWLDLEVDKRNLGIVEDVLGRQKKSKHQVDDVARSTLTKRAVSNASKANKPSLTGQSSFLQLLHLAIYNNALQYAESNPDIMLLHLLLQRLVRGLGVNSARHGLPMMLRLQEDIPTLISSSAKIAVGALVHGYMLSLADVFDFGTTSVGQAIVTEIDRRKTQGLWLDVVCAPAFTLQEISGASLDTAARKPNAQAVATGSLRPFDGRVEIVELIADSYSTVFRSPPSSPAMTPRRPMSPSARLKSSTSVKLTRRFSQTVEPDRVLPGHVKDQMLSVWTKEECAAAAEAAVARTDSLSGSKTGSGSRRRHLTVNGATGALVSGDVTPNEAPNVPRLPPLGQHRMLLRDSPKNSSRSVNSTASSPEGIPTVDDLKKILAMGHDARVPQAIKRVPLDGNMSLGSDSESMVSAEEFASSG